MWSLITAPDIFYFFDHCTPPAKFFNLWSLDFITAPNIFIFDHWTWSLPRTFFSNIWSLDLPTALCQNTLNVVGIDNKYKFLKKTIDKVKRGIKTKNRCYNNVAGNNRVLWRINNNDASCEIEIAKYTVLNTYVFFEGVPKIVLLHTFI